MTLYEEHLIRLAETDDRIVVLTAENRAAIRTLPGKLGSRFIDVGICEQTLLGVAAGLAQRGRRPIVHALAAFLTMRGFEFIRTDIGIGRLPVILVGGVPGLLSDGNGPTHQAVEDIGLMRGIPGMSVVAPADQSELTAAVSAALDFGGPCYLRYYDGPEAAEHQGDYRFGKAEIIGNREATVIIATYGLLVAQAVLAQRLLQLQGLDVCVLNMRTVAPLDEQTLLLTAQQAQLLVVVEDHFQTGGLFSAIAECFTLASLSVPVLPINLKHDWFAAGLLNSVLKATNLSGTCIADTIVAQLENMDGKHYTPTARLPLHRSIECDLG